MAKFNNTFDFIGNISIPKPERFHEIRINDAKTWEGHRMSFGVQESKMNTVFVELYGGFTLKNGKPAPRDIKTYSRPLDGNEKGGKLDVAWEDRFKPEIIDMVANFRKYIVDLETNEEIKKERFTIGYQLRDAKKSDGKNVEELEKKYNELSVNRHEFISEYDAIMFLAEKLEGLKAHKFRVRGNIDFSEYKGKYYKKFQPNYIEIVPSDYENKLSAQMNVFFDGDSFDDTDFKEEKKSYINGYVQNYNRATCADGFIPYQFIINGTKLDMENETHVKFYEILADNFKVKKGYYCLPFDVTIYRGAEKVDITYDDLTDEQKKWVDIGIKKLEDYAPKGGMFGTNIEEFRLVTPILEGEYDNGRLDIGLSDEEFEDLMFKSTADIKLSDVMKKEETKSEPKVEEPEEKEIDIKKTLNSLFG